VFSRTLFSAWNHLLSIATRNSYPSGGANTLTVTTQERKNAILSCTSEQKLVDCMDAHYHYFLQDINEYLEAIKHLTFSADRTYSSLPLALLFKFYTIEAARSKILEMLKIYFNKIYEHLLFTEPNFDNTELADMETFDPNNSFFRNKVYFPIMVALLSEINREKYPITDHRDIFKCFTMAVFNAFIPCDYIDIAYLIGGLYDVTKPDHNIQAIYAQISEFGFDDSACAPMYVAMFESKLNDIWISDYDKEEFIMQVMQELTRKTNAHDYGSKCREIADRFIRAFPEFKNCDEFITNLFFLYSDIYIKFSQIQELGKETNGVYGHAHGDIFDTFGFLLQRELDSSGVSYLEGSNPKIIKGLLMEFDKYFTYVHGFTFPGKAVVDKILSGDTSYRNKNEVYAMEAANTGDPNVRLNTKKTNTSSKLQSAQATIYHAYKNYKNNEKKVDSQISKMVDACKRLAIGDVRTEIIEGKKFSAIGLLKKALGTAAIFAFGPIKGLIALVVRYALKKKTTTAERRKILTELQVELDMVTEKIEDAKGDGNREAKYAMMRTQAELKAAIAKIKYGLEVDERNIEGAKNALGNAIGVNKRRGF